MTSAFLQVYGGPRDTREKGNISDGVRDTNNLLRKSHLIPHIAKQIGLKVPLIGRDIREALMPQNKLPLPLPKGHLDWQKPFRLDPDAMFPRLH